MAPHTIDEFRVHPVVFIGSRDHDQLNIRNKEFQKDVFHHDGSIQNTKLQNFKVRLDGAPNISALSISDNETPKKEAPILTPTIATATATKLRRCGESINEAWVLTRSMGQKLQQLKQTDRNNKRKISAIEDEMTELAKALLSIANMDELDGRIPFVCPDFTNLKKQRVTTPTRAENKEMIKFDLKDWKVIWEKLSDVVSALSGESVPIEDDLACDITELDTSVQEAVAAVRDRGSDAGTLKALRTFANTSEHFKDEICRAFGIEAVVQTMTDNEDSADVARNSSAVFLVLAHQHDLSKIRICQLGGIDALCNAIKRHLHNPKVVKPACAALWTIAVDNDRNKIFIANSGALSTVFEAMSHYMADSKIQECCCGLLSVLTRQIGVDNQCRQIYSRIKVAARLGKTEYVKFARRELVEKRQIAFTFLRSRLLEAEDRSALVVPCFETPTDELPEQAIASETLTFHALQEIRSMVLELGGVELILKSMRSQESNEEVQFSALSALSNLLNDESIAEVIAKHGGIDVIAATIQTHARRSPRVMHLAEELVTSLGTNAKIKKRVSASGARRYLRDIRRMEESVLDFFDF